jgi:hypothetical protein
MNNVGNSKLNLHEIMLLLALRTDTGSIASAASYHYKTIMAAAILTELLIKERIAIDEEKRGFLGMTSEGAVTVISTQKTGNEILDICLDKIIKSKRSHGTSHWVQVFASENRLVKLTADTLCEQKLIEKREGKILFFFNKTYYPALDQNTKNTIISSMKEAIFTNTEDINAQTAILIALMKEGSMLRLFFDKKKLAAQKGRIDAITKGTFASKAAKRAIEAANAAMVTVIAASAAVAVSS